MLWNIKSFAQSWDFNYTGGVQSWTCPETGEYKLEVWGAQGGSNSGPIISAINGGQGGYSIGYRTISKGTTYYIVVGGQGGNVTSLVAAGSSSRIDTSGKPGGYNGGGRGGDGYVGDIWGKYKYYAGGSGGGGATHIATTNRGVLSNYNSYRNEILIVAGGGGGVGGWWSGGHGGGTTGQNAASKGNSALGGTQSSGYQFGQGAPGDNGKQSGSIGDSSIEGRGGAGGGWYGGSRCTVHSNADNTNLGGAGGSGYIGGVSKASTQQGGRSGNGYAKITSVHTHNSSGTEYNQGNDNQHIKYTYCTGHGSDKSQNRSSTWENHTWVHENNTTDKCSKCGRTKTRLYYTGADYLNVSAMNPSGKEDQHSGQFKFSRDGINWSDWATDQIPSYVQRFQYGEKLYIQFQPYYDYYELRIAEIEHKPDSNLAKESGKQEWTYTVIKDSPPQGILFTMDYKHTTLALDPNGGMINGSSDKQVLSTQMQYSTRNWDDLSEKKPIRNGYTFEGWYDAATGGTKVYNADGSCIRSTKYFDSNGNSLCVNDLTVYAHWKINTYNIYYTLYGSNTSLQRTYTVESNNFTLPTNPTLQGYTFKGWIGGIDQKDPVKKGNTYQTPTKNITIEKGSYGDYFFRAIFEKIPSVDQIDNRTDDVYIAQSVPHEKQY